MQTTNFANQPIQTEAGIVSANVWDAVMVAGTWPADWEGTAIVRNRNVPVRLRGGSKVWRQREG